MIMKKKAAVFFSIVFFGSLALQAQTVLRYETHGFVPNMRNEVHLTESMQPGTSGSQVAWDFSQMEIKDNFGGIFDDPAFEKDASRFYQANTVVRESGYVFYFLSDQKATSQFGYVDKDGHLVEYDKPFVKMQFPFAYGDAYSGDYSATLYMEGDAITPIRGEYQVTADAQGTLRLPGGVSYRDALRVKTVKTAQQTIDDADYNTTHVSYSWYVNQHRFPVLVIQERTMEYPDGRTTQASLTSYNPVFVYHTAALAEDQPAAEQAFNVFPNPVRDYASIRFFVDEASDVAVTIVGTDGRQTVELENTRGFQGEWQQTISRRELGLAPGTYTVRLLLNGKQHTQTVVLL